MEKDEKNSLENNCCGEKFQCSGKNFHPCYNCENFTFSLNAEKTHALYRILTPLSLSKQVFFNEKGDFSSLRVGVKLKMDRIGHLARLLLLFNEQTGFTYIYWEKSDV